MRKSRKGYVVSLALFTVVVFLAMSFVCVAAFKDYIATKKVSADTLLDFYNKNIVLQMEDTLNYSQELSYILGDDWENQHQFHIKAEELSELEEVRYVALFAGDKVESAYPVSVYGDDIGRDLREFSYIYTLAKASRTPVVEGPLKLHTTGDEVFVFITPTMSGMKYLGEVVIALDKDYVIGQMNLDYLKERGYNYQLWRIDPQTGYKEFVAISDSHVDFSHASKTEFNLPTQWTLSILPVKGWISVGVGTLIVFTCVLVAGLILALAFSMAQNRRRKQAIRDITAFDGQTGMPKTVGFCDRLNKWMQSNPEKPFVLYYITLEAYGRLSQVAGEAGIEFVKKIPDIIHEIVEEAYIAGRVGESNFAIAVLKQMGEQERSDLAKALSIKLIWKINYENKKTFTRIGYRYADSRAGEGSAEELLQRLQAEYYQTLTEEQPVLDMIDNVHKLLNGEPGVVFGDYADKQMAELSTTLKKYQKHMEELLYFDPVFRLGNRVKYLRDVNMLISYNSRRKFRLYAVDIRSFSKYNEIFSVETGDVILHHVTNRLGLIFGENLYRINGDVFLGISFGVPATHAEPDVVIDQIQENLKEPVLASGSSFGLDYVVGVCDYPDYAQNAEKLLECIQAALDHAKAASGNFSHYVMFYNDDLMEVSRRENRIIKLLKRSIQSDSLEIWYQPLLNIEKRRYTAAEALIRLPDGCGGYVSAGEVISLAEKNRMVKQVGDFAISKACAFMKEQGIALGLERMGVNVSVQQLMVENSACEMLNQIQETGLDASHVTLEITETVLIQSIEQAEDVLTQWRKEGINIALDDFGTGFSSLNYLTNLPADVLKLDRSMLHDISTSEKQLEMLKLVVEMANLNGISVVAEGVEGMKEAKIVADTGVKYIQGYYYSTPLSKDALVELLKNQDNIEEFKR